MSAQAHRVLKQKCILSAVPKGALCPCRCSGKHLLRGKGLHAGETQPVCVRCSWSFLALLTSERWCFCLHARQLPAPLRAGFPHAVLSGRNGAASVDQPPSLWDDCQQQRQYSPGRCKWQSSKAAVICISIMSFKWARRHLDQRWSRHLMTSNVFLWHGSAEPAGIHRSHLAWPKGGFWMRHASTAPHFAQNKPVRKTRAAQINLLKLCAPRPCLHTPISASVGFCMYFSHRETRSCTSIIAYPRLYISFLKKS